MPRLPFKVLQDLDLPLTEVIAGKISYIQDAFLTFPYEARETLPKGDRDLVVLVSKSSRGKALGQLCEYRGRIVVVFAAGDASVRSAYLRRRPGLSPNIVAAFATNNAMADKRVLSVPLGVRVNKLRPLQFVRQNRRREERGLLYGNFTLKDEHYPPDRASVPHIRKRLVERLRGEPWVNLDVSGDHRSTEEDLVRYYAQTSAHKFALSPEGHGVDCYRTWETLYLGTIPIVMVSTETSAFADLPILFTEDYSELSESYLEERWQEMSARKFEIERMLSSYYTSRFLDAVSQLDDPRFVCWQMEGSPSDRFVRAMERSSRSPTGIVSETPVPPFTTRGRDLTNPEAWNIPDQLRLEQLDGALRLVATGGAHGGVEIPFHTIAGAPFRFSARVSPETREAPVLAVDAAARPEVLAAVQVGNPGATDLTLDFVARSERTVVSIRAPKVASEASWLLSDISFRANLQQAPLRRSPSFDGERNVLGAGNDALWKERE